MNYVLLTGQFVYNFKLKLTLYFTVDAACKPDLIASIRGIPVHVTICLRTVLYENISHLLNICITFKTNKIRNQIN